MSEPKIAGEGPITLVSEKDQKRIQKAKDLIDRKLEDARTLMKLAAFRRLAYEFLDVAKVHEDISVFGDQGYTTMNLAGQKKMGLWFLGRIMRAAPEAYVQMCKEADAEKIQIEKELNKGE